MIISLDMLKFACKTFTVIQRIGLTVHFLSLVIAVCIANPACAQHLNHTRNELKATAAVPKGTVAVDGALNPELIPDNIAYLHFFRVLSKDPNAADQALEERRRQAYLHYFFTSGCGTEGKEDRTLNRSQIERLLATVDRLMPVLNAANARLASSPNKSEHDAAKDQMTAIVLAAATELPMSVDSDAAAKTASHISDHVKKHIRIISTQIPAKMH